MSDEEPGTAGGCCAPARSEPSSAPQRPHIEGEHIIDHDFVDLPGGPFVMGSDAPTPFPADGEGPTRIVEVAPFRISPYAVTNARFSRFVEATGHVTEAERFEWSFVFHLLLPDDFEPTRAIQGAPWWRQVYGADWRHPAGPQSSLDDLGDHPVVHVSWNDATAYCAWAGVRLPTEAEWEYAARGGLVQQPFAWGAEFAPGGRTMCNIFEGDFPTINTAADGYVATAPVDAFDPNGYGLFNVAGNVWEWCQDRFATPSSPDDTAADATRVIRGGSYLCHDSYCNRYRVAARTSNTIDSTTGNMGFRVAGDAPAA